MLPVLAGADQIRLDRFTDAQATELLDGLAGKTRLSDVLRHAIIERSDGVPLFVEELAQNLLTTGQVSLPSTLEGALLARLGSALKEREIAQAAAIIGRSFDLDVVALVAGLPCPGSASRSGAWWRAAWWPFSRAARMPAAMSSAMPCWSRRSMRASRASGASRCMAVPPRPFA